MKFGCASDVLIADGGTRFVGAVAGGGGTLVVRGPGTGKINALGGAGVLAGAVSGDFAGFGACVIGTIGTWGLVGANTLATLTDKGSLPSTDRWPMARAPLLQRCRRRMVYDPF